MKDKISGRSSKFTLSKDHKISDFYVHFKKAKDDNTLDIMFQGMKKQLSVMDCEESLKSKIFNDIYIAYGNRQEDFDGAGAQSHTIADHVVKSIERKVPDLSPEEKLSAALKGLYQG